MTEPETAVDKSAGTSADTSAEDVRQLRDALRRALAVPADAPAAPDPGWRTKWPALSELGITGVCVSEERGGFGLRADAAVAVAADLGAALHGSPYAGLVASAHALGQCGDADGEALDSVRYEVLEGVLAGEQLCAFGTLSPDGSGARLVAGAPEADYLLLADESAGTMLLAGPGSWRTTTVHSFDVTRSCADISLDTDPEAVGTAVRRIPLPATAVPLFRLLIAADAVGCVQRTLERTVAYAKQRETFGKPIGGYQAVQHRLVDHGVRARGMTLTVQDAARALTSGATALDDVQRLVAIAEVSVSTGAGHIVHDLLQLTGGIGFTWEYGLHFYDRRAHQDARLTGNPRTAARSLARLEGWTVAG